MIDRKAANRDALKRLRERGRAGLEAAQARLKEQTRIVNELTRLLKEGPKTVPELSEAARLPTETVFWQLMALKKYGKVLEGDQDGDYLQYRLSEQ
jgi:predicted Rossmann fold nucleotide-binding protein DprA/Smf involved in DNA uptake